MKQQKKSLWGKTEKFLAGKGFYIVLLACAAVIGVSAWVMLSAGKNLSDPEPSTTVSQTVQPRQSDAVQTQTVPETVTPKAPEVAVIAPAEQQETELEKLQRQEDESEPQPVQETDAEPEQPPAAFVWPVAGETVKGYTDDELVYNKTMADWRVPPAMDLAADLGTKVLAAATGTVEQIFEDDLYGTTVIIDHGGGLKSVYANLAASPAVSAGDSVAMGAVIGAVGDTALGETVEVSHLHFAMECDGVPVNPEDYLSR